MFTVLYISLSLPTPKVRTPKKKKNISLKTCFNSDPLGALPIGDSIKPGDSGDRFIQ
jgi:hypothetical protein